MNAGRSSWEPELGYFFYPPPVPGHPGHPQMDVTLAATPSYEHFDPVRASYAVAARAGGVETLIVSHPWSQRRRYRVCAGRINLVDRQGKAVEAFSLGGDLDISAQGDWTLCALSSAAPIFFLFSAFDLAMWLTAEFEILLAQQKAHWDPVHPHSFEEHLAVAEPLQLYCCCLQALQNKARDIHCGSEELDQAGRHFLREEIDRLKRLDLWPEVVCPVEWLFAGEVTRRRQGGRQD